MTIKFDRFTLDNPIVQGGMGIGISLGNLAGHVARLGGMGTISSVGIGFREKDYFTNRLEANKRALKKEFEKAKEIAKGKGMIAVNIMTAITEFKELASYAAKIGVDALVCGAGIPKELPEYVKDSKTLIAPIVSSKRALDLIVRLWSKRYDRLPDFVVIEGKEAGGHLGYSLEDLGEENNLSETLEDIVNYKKENSYKFPLVVAGSIRDSAEAKYYFDRGADAIQVGTKFIATHEADVSEEFKNKITKASSEDLEIFISPVGMPGRIVKTKFSEKVKELGRIKPTRCVNCLKPCNPKTTKYCISDALMNSASGKPEEGIVFSGTNIDTVNEVLSVEEVFDYYLKDIES